MEEKKRRLCLIVAIICNVIILSFIIIKVTKIFSISKTNIIDGDYFVNYMNSNHCLVNDILDNGMNSGMNDYITTNSDSCPYSISYITFNDKKILNEYLINGRKEVLKNNSNITSKKNVSINLFSNYYEYSTSGDYYNVIVCKDNSILYATASKEYKDDIINIFRDLNYEYEFSIGQINEIKYIVILIWFIIIMSTWGIEKKIRDKGWIALIPIYNIGCLSKDVLGSPWYTFLLLLPLVNIIFIFTLCYHIGKVFNKNKIYCLLMMIIPTILLPVVAFDKSKYDSSML